MKAQFEDIKPHVGTMVHVDRETLLDPELARSCRALLEARSVLVFPRINVTDAEQLAFTELLGGTVNLTSRAVSDTPEAEAVYKVTLDKTINRQPEYVLGTFFWHMDGLTVDMPQPKATLLSARKVAARGGQTEFASTAAAFAHLPEDEQAELRALRAMHSTWASLRPLGDIIPEEDREKLSIGIVKEHPLIRERASGHDAMIIGSTADYVVGMPKAHGRALLTRLMEWAAQPDFSYRHQWGEGDFVVWDNCGALHRVIPYDAESGRMMHRTTVSGTA